MPNVLATQLSRFLDVADLQKGIEIVVDPYVKLQQVARKFKWFTVDGSAAAFHFVAYLVLDGERHSEENRKVGSKFRTSYLFKYLLPSMNSNILSSITVERPVNGLRFYSH